MKTKTRYEIQTYCKLYNEWEAFDGIKYSSENTGINRINAYRKDQYFKIYKFRLVEITERVIKAWPIQQLLPYCTHEDWR